MLTRLVNFVTDREPVATATGVAGGVIAIIGLLTAFDIVVFTPTQITAVGAAAAWVAGYLARLKAWAPNSVEVIKLQAGRPTGVEDA